MDNLFSMLPESPRWLLSKNQPDKALKILHKVAKTNKKELNTDTWNEMLDEEKNNVTIFYYSILEY